MTRGAVHNALGRGVLSSALSRAVGDSVGASGLERYGETLTPTLDLWRREDWAYLRGEILSSYPVTVAAVVAEYSHAALLNPSGSNSLVIVERGGMQTAGSNWLYAHLATEAAILATLGAVGHGVGRDTRSYRGAAMNVAVGTLYSGSDVAQIGTRIGWAIEPAVASFADLVDCFPIVLSPGWGLALICGTLNTSGNFRITWRERRAFPGELE